jgi:hypothetical protein
VRALALPGQNLAPTLPLVNHVGKGDPLQVHHVALQPQERLQHQQKQWELKLEQQELQQELQQSRQRNRLERTSPLLVQD